MSVLVTHEMSREKQCAAVGRRREISRANLKKGGVLV